jgi:hypothetical protein
VSVKLFVFAFGFKLFINASMFFNFFQIIL